jgi:hypothetical protein
MEGILNPIVTHVSNAYNVIMSQITIMDWHSHLNFIRYVTAGIPHIDFVFFTFIVELSKITVILSKWKWLIVLWGFLEASDVNGIAMVNGPTYLAPEATAHATYCA